jgi:hypothetical protein
LLKCVMKQQHDTEISAVPLGRYRLAKWLVTQLRILKLTYDRRSVGQFVLVSAYFGVHDQVLIFFVWQLLSKTRKLNVIYRFVTMVY